MVYSAQCAFSVLYRLNLLNLNPGCGWVGLKIPKNCTRLSAKGLISVPYCFLCLFYTNFQAGPKCKGGFAETTGVVIEKCKKCLGGRSWIWVTDTDPPVAVGEISLGAKKNYKLLA